ncbi:MAG: fumarylacetoacetate hydrolase family protein [Chloroflexi bacterium]|jgi:2-keto-4-pentenoate hydratase/2-oxohepta-3-ene-1,7-dioic acid hydratase in catechol pathway|nr:fumarylacetoacetate hydrolase family protein [Chloroflexota bacterium]
MRIVAYRPADRTGVGPGAGAPGDAAAAVAPGGGGAGAPGDAAAAVAPGGATAAVLGHAPVPLVGFLISDGPGDPGRIVPLAALADPRLGSAALDRSDAARDLRGLLHADPGLRRTEAALDAAVTAGPEPSCMGLDDVHLAAPIPDPGKVVCVGQNYAAHVREQNAAMPDRPMLFAKFANAVVGDAGPVIRHAGTHALDLEAELAVVVGARMRRVSPADALGHVAGYTAANDISARDLQGSKPALAEGERGDGQWLRAKGSDTFCPLGPAVVTPAEVGDPGDLRLRSWRVPAAAAVDGPGGWVLMQDARTDDMVFDVAHLLSFISHAITLEAGDVVLTGTPSGVGVFRDPPVFLEPGDVVVVEVERIGRLVNPIVAADGSAPVGSPAARLLAGERPAIP